MQKLITYENLRSFAYVNDRICEKPIKGIVLSFFGLGKTVTFDVDTKDGEMLLKAEGTATSLLRRREILRSILLKV